MKNINTQEYWNKRFETGNWKLNGGQEQSEFFYKIAIDLLPDWLVREIMSKSYSICDIGCAEGDGTALLYDNFFNSEIYGIDFSEEGIELAKSKFNNIQFNVGDIKKFICQQDVLFSSNTLEHFRAPWSIVEDIVKGHQKYTVLLLPYNEVKRIDEHFSSFGSNSIPMKIGTTTLVYYDIVDCNEILNTYWSGEQVLLVYAHEVEASLYKYTLERMVDNTKNKKQISRIEELISQVEILEANINVLKAEAVEYKEILRIKGEEVENIDFKNESLMKQIEEQINKNRLLKEEIDKQIEVSEKLNTKALESQEELVTLQRIKDQLTSQIKLREKDREKDFKNKNQKLIIEINKLEKEINSQIDKLEELTYERDKFSKDLWKIHHSTFWKVAKRYYYLRDNLPIIKNIYRFLKAKKQPVENLSFISEMSIDENTNAENLYPIQVQKIDKQLDKFLENCIEENAEQILLVYSGVKFVESEGQRIIRLINEALLKDIKIVFCYWRWNQQEPLDQSHHENLINIPIDIFLSLKDKIIDFNFPEKTRKTMLVEFPHPTTFHIISQANCKNWTTIYDVIDEWSEFHKVGEAVWYEEEIERYLVNNSKFVTATAYQLGEKVKKYGVGEVTLIKNAVNPRGLTVQKDSYTQGKEKLNIGYFGHLTEAWFDWNLIIKLAKKNPEWEVHIIGYGAPDNLKLPNNIHMYGKVEHKKLPEYAKDWDVAIIPFKNSKLTESVDPIKVYEYLHLRLPVVATNMPDLKDYPYTQIANNAEEFERAILELTNKEIDFGVMEQFVKNNTWERRLEQMLELSQKDSKFIVG